MLRVGGSRGQLRAEAALVLINRKHIQSVNGWWENDQNWHDNSCGAKFGYMFDISGWSKVHAGILVYPKNNRTGHKSCVFIGSSTSPLVLHNSIFKWNAPALVHLQPKLSSKDAPNAWPQCIVGDILWSDRRCWLAPSALRESISPSSLQCF